MKIKGFTLAELLIVCMIIGVVIALVLPTIIHKAKATDESTVKEMINKESLNKFNSTGNFNNKDIIKTELKDNDCKIEEIEITANGVKIKCH